jgi:hypothetical protein
MSLSPAERSERARIAANARWAREPDRLAATAAGRSAAFQKILNEVDPHQELSEAQRYKLAKSAWNEHLSRMRFTLMRKRSKAKVGLAVDGGSAPEDSEGDPSSGSPTPPAPQGTAPTHFGPPDHIALRAVVRAPDMQTTRAVGHRAEGNEFIRRASARTRHERS